MRPTKYKRVRPTNVHPSVVELARDLYWNWASISQVARESMISRATVRRLAAIYKWKRKDRSEDW